MKAIQIAIYLFLFQVFLFIFSQVSAYSIQVNAPDTWVDISGGMDLGATILNIGGIASVTAALIGVASYFLAGTSGLQAITLSVLTGFFTGLFYNTYQVFSTISTYLGEWSYILNYFLILLATAFIISMIYGVAQIGMGGGRAYD